MNPEAIKLLQGSSGGVVFPALVGYNSNTTANANTTNVALDALTGGTDTSPSEGDLVIAGNLLA